MSWLYRGWGGLAAFVDYALKAYLRAVDPRFLVTIFLVINAGVSVKAWFRTENWNDFYTESGYWATVTGFLVAISELYRARTTAEQVRAAVQLETVRHRRVLFRDSLERATRVLIQVSGHVDQFEWRQARERIADLVELLTRINVLVPEPAGRWTDLMNRFDQAAVRFAIFVNGRRGAFDAAEWLTLVRAAERHLKQEIATYDHTQEANDAP